MDIDCTVDMAKYIGNHKNGEKFNKLIDKYSLSSLGWYNFMTMYKLEEAPVVVCSAACHYSLLKAMVLLGLGKDQLIQVPTDEHDRLNAQGKLKTKHAWSFIQELILQKKIKTILQKIITGYLYCAIC